MSLGRPFRGRFSSFGSGTSEETENYVAQVTLGVKRSAASPTVLK